MNDDSPFSAKIHVSHKYVYLAGPITGQLSFAATDWRTYVSSHLAEDILSLSPTRDVTDPTPDHPLTFQKLRHGKSIVSRDRCDIMRCDLVFANLLEVDRISIGTIGEIFWADAYRKPIIIVVEETNPHHHLMLLELAGWVFDDLEPAITKANLLLSDLNGRL